MQSVITTKFETTEFAGLTTKIINPQESPFTVLDMTIKPGFGAPAHISEEEDKLFVLLEGQVKYLVGDQTEVAGPGSRISCREELFTASPMRGRPTRDTSSSPRRVVTRNSSAICTGSPSRASSTWTCCRRSQRATANG